ncbi:hypothetical protein IV73_GL000306 [Weissella kandleri]|uniref:SGNH hydrolase-type esterase domain-containing protein n=2 Tax=Weissella kandleri TaxID=1616 RepID=A0A0R2JEN2_9LACO|nr:hypothetical protein IV73_GL000306 [Weissella kandleri]
MEVGKMKNNIKLTLSDGNLVVDFQNDSVKNSVHLWRIDQQERRNRERVYISGWTDQKSLTVPLYKSGNYYVQIFNFDTGKSLISEQVTVNDEYIMDHTPSLYGIDRQREEYFAKMMQKMYVVGMDELRSTLLQFTNSKNISIFVSSFEGARAANFLSADEFFRGTLQISHLLAADRMQVGYQMSMTFRQTYEPINIYADKLGDKDIVIDFSDGNENSVNTHKDLNRLRQSGAEVIPFNAILNAAFINKVLVNPLAKTYELGAQVLYVRFPTSKGIQNKSAYERQAAQTSISKIREMARHDQFPQSLLELNESSEYMQQVIDGWSLDTYAGYDLLQDKAETYVNIQDGHRMIPDEQKTQGERNVYFLGNSVMYGIGSDDANTIPSIIAEKAKADGLVVNVENRANFSMNDYIRGTNLLKHLPIHGNDVVVFGSHQTLNAKQQAALKGNYLDLQPYVERPHDDGELFVDMTHLTRKGYRRISEPVYEVLKDNFLKN